MLLTIGSILEKSGSRPSAGVFCPASQIVVVTSLVSMLDFLRYLRRGRFEIPPCPMKPSTFDGLNTTQPHVRICIINFAQSIAL